MKIKGDNEENPYRIEGNCDLDDEMQIALLKVLKLHAPEGLGSVRGWDITLGPTMFLPDDFVPRQAIFINGYKVGEVALQKFMDHPSKMTK